MRRISSPVLDGAVTVPSYAGFFTDDAESAVSLTGGVYVKTTGVVAQADEVFGFQVQPGLCSVQSNGSIGALSSFSANAKLSIVSDPENASKKCWLIRCAASDADTAGTGAKRTEFSPTVNGENGIVAGTPFMFCFANRLVESWAGTSDKQITGQVHTGASVSPAFAIVVRGDVFDIDLRMGTTTNQKQLIAYSGEIGTSWNKWVIAGMIHSERGYLRCWRNGIKIVDYTGPLGYSDNVATGYVKAGIYHWTNGNPWDLAVADRGVYQKGFWQVRPELFSEADLVAALAEI